MSGPAATIADAERLIADRKPDVAIVDINLRGERANPLLDRLQEEGIPVIVITGYTEVSLQPGKVEAILQKPVSVEQFLAILRPIVARLPDR
ncbi:DNA-binding NtrC family response regulator [Bradyrhizobium sp. AZCC 1610]|uniref:response regulator n=1 Tax=Bradyrhizobium sp. AZCC 1610 TaxID=3117020 RepID=UPI002FF38F8C